VEKILLITAAKFRGDYPLTLDTDDAIAIFREAGEYLARNQDHENAMGKAAAKDRPFIGPSAPASGSLKGPILTKL
jgi:hypothetical protein